MFGKLKLIIVLKAGFEVITAVCLLLLDEFAESHRDKSGDVVFVLVEEVLESLGGCL
jgi:hypothetical protein